MFEQAVIVHAEEHYRDLLREAEAERRLHTSGVSEAVHYLVALGGALIVLVLMGS